jgi:hypothetical protein
VTGTLRQVGVPVHDVDRVGDLTPESLRDVGRVGVKAFLVLAHELFFGGPDALDEPERVLAGGVELFEGLVELGVEYRVHPQDVHVHLFHLREPAQVVFFGRRQLARGVAR